MSGIFLNIFGKLANNYYLCSQIVYIRSKRMYIRNMRTYIRSLRM